MNNFKRLLAVGSILATMLVMQVAPAFASVDGRLWKTVVSTPMNTYNDPSSATIMTMGANEAITHLGASTNGYELYMGCKAGVGPVNGYVLDSKVATPYTVGMNTTVNVYADEAESYIIDTVNFYDWLNSNHWYQTHQNMILIQVTDYVDNTGYTHPLFGYAHTNFRSGNASAYYVYLN